MENQEDFGNLDSVKVDRVVNAISDLLGRSLDSVNDLEESLRKTKIEEINAIVKVQTQDFEKYLEDLEPSFQEKAKDFYEKGVEKEVIVKDVLRYTLFQDILNKMTLLYSLYASIDEEQEIKLDDVAKQLHLENKEE